MDLRAIARNVPNYSSYFTVDELYASTAQLKQDFPALVHVETVGTSRQGDPIEYIRIGNGGLNAVVLGGSHPNEPLGCMVIEYFTRLLCEDSDFREALGYTWHFIKCIDPDATRHNEGWFQSPFSIPKYSRHYFRPPVLMQPEFTFPYRYKDFEFNRPLPETKALMAVMERAQPQLYYSLHCGGYGGAFYAVSAPCEPLYKPLHEILSWFDLNILSYELIAGDVGGDIQLADGIYQQADIPSRYDALEAAGIKNPADHIPHGGTGIEYSANYGAFLLNAEVDYCQDPRVSNQTPSDMSLNHAIAAASAFEAKMAGLFLTIVIPALQDMRLDYNQQIIAIEYANVTDDDLRPTHANANINDLMATVSQVHQHTEYPQLRAMRHIGQLLGMMDDEIADGNPSAAIRHAHQTLSQQFDEIWQSIEPQLQYRIVPLRELIGYQLCAGLAAAQYVRENL